MEVTGWYMPHDGEMTVANVRLHEEVGIMVRAVHHCLYGGCRCYETMKVVNPDLIAVYEAVKEDAYGACVCLSIDSCHLILARLPVEDRVQVDTRTTP